MMTCCHFKSDSYAARLLTRATSYRVCPEWAYPVAMGKSFAGRAHPEAWALTPWRSAASVPGAEYVLG